MPIKGVRLPIVNQHDLNMSKPDFSLIEKGKSAQIDSNSGQIKPNGLKDKFLRVFVPNYAENQDLKIAQLLIASLENCSGGVNTSEINAKKFKAAEAFMRKRLAKYGTDAEIGVAKKKLQHFLNMDKISKKLNIPYDVLKKNPKFVNFAIANHLHYRIDSTYQERGLGVTVIENTIYLKKRHVDPRSGRYTEASELMEWTKLPTDSKGKIKDWELMAYGWQPHKKEENTTLEPVKIITLEPGEKAEYAIELVSAKPTGFNIKTPMSNFGHSWLRIYEPIFDKAGRPTNQMKMYSIGFFLRLPKSRLITPDTFEFVEREKVTTREKLTPEQFQRVIKNTETIMRVFNGDIEGEENVEAISPRVVDAVDHWVESNCITCGTFASRMFEDFTGHHVDGRLLLMKILIPDSWRHRLADLTTKVPFLKGTFNKIAVFSHGYFPTIMLKDQAKITAAQS